MRFLPAIGSFHWIVFRVTPAYIDSGHSARGIRIWFRMETLNKRDILKIKPGDTCPIYFFNETMFSGSLLYTEVAIKRK